MASPGAQVDFCFLNSKANRRKLIRTIFQAPRRQLEVLPYWSRMVATLSLCLRDVAPPLLQMLEEEFTALAPKRVSRMRQNGLGRWAGK